MINESRLKQSIKGALESCQQETDNPDASLDKIASAIAKAVIVEFKAAIVIGVCPPGGGALQQGKIQ